MALAYETSTQIPKGTADEKLQLYGKADMILGSGTYGTVSKHGKYAIKKMVNDEDGVSLSTLREIACILRLNHPYIIKFIDVFANIKYTYAVMPLASNTLNKYIEEKALYVRLDLAKIAYQIVSAVGYCSSRGILHRDVKPENILIFESLDGTVAKLADFGLSRANSCSFDTGFTQEVFSIWYRPPEVILGGRYTEAADVWSVGCVLYNLYTRIILFPGVSDYDMIHKMSDEFGPLEDQWKDIVDTPNWNNFKRGQKPKKDSKFDDIESNEVRAIIRSLLQIDPDRRESLEDIIHTSYFDPVRIQEIDALVELCSCPSILLLRDDPNPYNLSLDPSSVKDREVWFDIAIICKQRELRISTIMMSYLIFEKYLSKQVRPTDYVLKLVANTSICIAAKYNEVVFFEIQQIEQFSTITSNDIILTEVRILQEIEFDLYNTTAADYLISYLNNGRYDSNVDDLAKKILPIVHIAAISKFSHREEALAALFIACTQKRCSFKHTSRLSSKTSELIGKAYKMLEAHESKDLTGMTPIDWIKVTSVL